MKQITIYTTDFCGYCQRVKGLLAQRGLQYTEINLSRDPDSRSLLLEKTGLMTFPQVLIDDELLGGYTETAAAAASGRLDELLAA
jgi:glutaredoxin 3